MTRDNTGSAATVNWEVIEFTDGKSVQSGDLNFATADTQKNVTISEVTLGKAISFIGGQTFGGQAIGRSAKSDDDLPGIAMWTAELTSTTNLQLTRAASGTAADLTWFVLTDGSGNTVDKAKPVLLSASGPNGAGATAGLFNDVNDRLDLVFSETLNPAPSEANLEAALTFAGGATDVGDNLPDIPGSNPIALATTTVANDTIQVTFNTSNTVNANLLTPGTHTVQVTTGTNITDVASNTANTTPAAVPIGDSLDLQVTAASDDANERDRASEVPSLNADLILMDANTTDVRHWGGFRWTNVTVPPGATITTALLDLNLHTNQDDALVTVYGENVDNAATFTATTDNIKNRPKTIASVSWAVDSLVSGADVWLSGESPDARLEVKSLVQEIVSRPGWSSGNALVLFSQPGTAAFKQLRPQSYDQAPVGTLGAKLHIAYTVDESAAITGTSPASLTESNLNGATVTVTITDATYDASLFTTDFTLGGAPAGTTITSVARDSATQATLTLGFDGTDFDTNASLSVTVLQAAFSPVAGPATTGTVTVTAVLESAAITGTNPASLTETNLNGADVTVTITNATYDASLFTTDFTLNGAPTGTTINSVARDTGMQATLTLAFDGTDFDTNASMSVTVLQAAFSPVTGSVTTGTVTVTTVVESAAITGTNPASLTETNLNGADVTVTITNATYDASLFTTDFTLNGAPTGTTINSVARDTGTQATLTLLFDGTDFDTNASMSVTVLQAAFSPVTGSVTTGTVTVTAVVETDLQQVHYRWRNDNGGEGDPPGFDVGNGADGALAPTGTFDLNASTSGSRTYADGIAYHVTTPADSATSVTRVSGTNTNGIVIGDELLLINLQGASGDAADVGNYEFVEVQSVTSGPRTCPLGLGGMMACD